MTIVQAKFTELKLFIIVLDSQNFYDSTAKAFDTNRHEVRHKGIAAALGLSLVEIYDFL